MRTYKVWLQVELVDDAIGIYENQGEHELLSEFKEATRAHAFAADLAIIGDTIAPHYNPTIRI